MKNINLIPKTILGKLSVGLAILFFLILSLFYLLCALGQRGGDTFFSNLFLAIPGLSMAISGIAAFFTGFFSIFKKRERAILVFLSSTVGFLVLFFVLAEILFPH